MVTKRSPCILYCNVGHINGCPVGNRAARTLLNVHCHSSVHKQTRTADALLFFGTLSFFGALSFFCLCPFLFVSLQFMAVNDYRSKFTPEVIEQFRGNLQRRWPTPADFELPSDYSLVTAVESDSDEESRQQLDDHTQSEEEEETEERRPPRGADQDSSVREPTSASRQDDAPRSNELPVPHSKSQKTSKRRTHPGR